MCDAKQRKRKPKVNKTESSEMLMGSGRQRSDSNGAVVVVISILAIVVVVASGFILYNRVDFDNIGRTLPADRTNDFDNIGSRLPAGRTNDFDIIDGGSRIQVRNEHDFYLNQMNAVTSRGRVNVAGDSVYVLSPNDSGEIIVFDHDFNEEKTIIVRDDWLRIERFYLTDDAIYYTVGLEGDLYRYDRITSQNQQLASNIFHQTIVGDLVFHLDKSWGDSNLYVFDKVTGDTHVIFEGDIRQFSVNSSDNTIIFTDNRSLYSIDFNGDYLEELNDDTWGFAFDGYTLIWFTLWSDLYMMDINTHEEIRVAHDIDPSNIVLTEDYIIFVAWSDYLYVINRSTNDLQQLTDNIMNFSVVGGNIVYEQWDNFSLQMMDFYGNNKVLIENEWD